jgi:hypothetical protein
MTERQILVSAIAKAVDNGYIKEIDGEEAFLGTKNCFGSRLYWSTKKYPRAEGFYVQNVFDLIYSHDFAKALWGNDDDRESGGDFSPQAFIKQPLWKSMLQQMVIAEDPIKYLGDNI